MDINKWCDNIINGSGGFISYEDHELPIWKIPRERAIAEFVIRALANTDCEGSGEVVDAIITQRGGITITEMTNSDILKKVYPPDEKGID